MKWMFCGHGFLGGEWTEVKLHGTLEDESYM